MLKVSLKEAEGHLDELIEEEAAGQEVVITNAGGRTVRLMLVRPEEQEERGPYGPLKTVGHAPDRFIGTWSAEQAAEVLKVVEIFEQVDESLWQ